MEYRERTLNLSAPKRCRGILTFLMTAEHTRRSRARIGPQAGLNVVCAMLAESDPVAARHTARTTLAYYLTLDYYHREWRKLGFTDAGHEHLACTRAAGLSDVLALQALCGRGKSSSAAAGRQVISR